MDLIYIPEVLTHGFYRAPQYRDYEQPWNKDYFSHGRSTQVHSQRLPQHPDKKLLSKDNCYLCRENKRRGLAAYIRGKSRKTPCQDIHEEEEEEGEEEEYDAANINEATSIDNQISMETLKNRNEYLKNNNKSQELK